MTDPVDVTEPESWYVLASSADNARELFRSAVRGGDESVWGFSFGSRPEHAGDDDYYVTELSEDEDSDEMETTMIRIGPANRVDEDEVDTDRLLEES